MPEHRIRLRGAWDLLADSELGGPTRRVDLPTPWSSLESTRLFRLQRRFGRPPVGPRIALELANVPGLREVRLNGAVLGWSPGDPAGPVRIVLTMPLASRNTLELDADLNGSERDFGDPLWGAIALVFEEP